MLNRRSFLELAATFTASLIGGSKGEKLLLPKEPEYYLTVKGHPYGAPLAGEIRTAFLHFDLGDKLLLLKHELALPNFPSGKDCYTLYTHGWAIVSRDQLEVLRSLENASRILGHERPLMWYSLISYEPFPLRSNLDEETHVLQDYFNYQSKDWEVDFKCHW